jgi:hypothetical protein
MVHIMRKLKRGAAAGLVAGGCLWAGTAVADPKSIVDHLQATPASRLDLSLASMSSMLYAQGLLAGYSAFVDYEDGKMMIRAYSDTAKPTEAACKKIADDIKRNGGIDLATGYPAEPASAYESLFTYPGDDEFKIDQSYAETVDSMFMIMVVIGQTGGGTGMVCQGPLLSTKLTYERQ